MGRQGGGEGGGHQGRNTTQWCEDIDCDAVTEDDLADCSVDFSTSNHGSSNDSNSTSADGIDADDTDETPDNNPRRLGRTLRKGDNGGRGGRDKWANFTADEIEEAKMQRRTCKCCNNDA